MPFNEVMSKFKRGTLKSGSGGKVKSRKQAVAIGMQYKSGKAKDKGFASIKG